MTEYHPLNPAQAEKYRVRAKTIRMVQAHIATNPNQHDEDLTAAWKEWPADVSIVDVIHDFAALTAGYLHGDPAALREIAATAALMTATADALDPNDQQ